MNAIALIEAKPAHLLVAVSTNWCVPCRLMKPVLRKLAHEFALPTVLLDGGQEVAFAGRYGVDSFPTSLFFGDGALFRSVKGYRGYREQRSQIITFVGHLSATAAAETERIFDDGIVGAVQAIEDHLAPASGFLEPYVAAVNPMLEAHWMGLRRAVEAGRLSARDAHERQGAERQRFDALFQDKSETLRAAQEAALLDYEETANDVADRFITVPQ